ncbi:MAG: hypothetical protein U9Q12_01255 [Patescibacteria group bacterium]|nr:hypothetical protein [Patescibacteria group bacterium]
MTKQVGCTAILHPEQIKKFGGIGPAFFLAQLEAVHEEIIHQKNLLNDCIDSAVSSQRLCSLIIKMPELQHDLCKLYFVVSSVYNNQAANIPLAIVVSIKSELCIKYTCTQPS